MPHDVLSRNAVAVGMCALIPLPWLDGSAARLSSRKAWEMMAGRLGRPLDAVALQTLTEDRGNLLLGCLVGLFWWPIRKLFRTFFYFLTVKDAVDWAIESALRGEMVRRALAAGLLPERAPAVREAMDLAFRGHRHSPLTRWLLRQQNPRLPWAPGRDPLTGAVGWLAERGGGALVVGRFEQHLGLSTASPPLIAGPTDEAGPP